MGTRADNHEGSCRQITNGKHKGRWRVQYTVTDELGRRKRLSRLFPKQAEGKEFLRGLKLGGKIEAANRGKELTLGAWFDWLTENDWPESLAENTIQGRVGRFNKHVRPHWGDVPLLRIDPMAVKTFYKSLKEAEVGQHTIHAIKRDLVRVFNQAALPYKRVPMNWGNPFKLTVDVPQRREAVALTPDQGRAALQCPDLVPERRAMLALFLLAGVRLSEQMALTKGQIRFDEDLIFVDRAVKIGTNGRQWVGLPKGDKRRLAVMCPTLKAMLLEVTDGMADDQVVWSAATENQPRMKSLVYATWRTIVEVAGLPAQMTPHDCRLTHINWIEKLMPTVSTTTLKEHVGHAVSGVTEINYTRPITPSQEILRKAIEETLRF